MSRAIQAAGLSSAILASVLVLGCRANPCGVGGRPLPIAHGLPVVETTVEPDGTIIDWVPIEAQTSDGIIATPPTSTPRAATSGPDPVIGIQRRGPPGTVPFLRPKQTTCQCDPGYRQSAPGGQCIETSCRGPGWYEAGKEGSYAPCCDGLTEVPYKAAGTGAGPSERKCFEPLLRIYGCVKGTCGDGVCEPGESGKCGCELDCPSATWELKEGAKSE